MDIIPVVYQRAEFAPVVQAFLSSFDQLHAAGIIDEQRVLRVT